ncbi:MAG: carboxy terminal-processing peptidase [Elusimicrobiota bacterium]|nr:carboxy terminal-processing peptidase [Elusimicrobiota bacterium]
MRSLFKFYFSLFFVLSLAAGPCAAASSGTVEAGPAAPVTAQLVTGILEEGHYDRRPVTAGTSREMLRLYLRMYDPHHLFFLAADIEEFNSRFGPGLAPRLKAGDVEPAYFIFNRFLTRLQERVGWTHELVRSTFTFTSDETMLADRREAAWPADEAGARELWRKRIEADFLQKKLDGAKPVDWAGDVQKNYDRLLDNYREFDSADVLQGYLAALAGCFDPHSAYMAPAAEENFDISLGISLIGIGVTLQTEEGYAKIVSIIPGGPADKSNAFHPNDRIEAVAQGSDGPFTEAVGMRLDRLVGLIRGEKGTVVRLRIIPADALDPSVRAIVALVRDKILLRDQQARAQLILIPEKDGRDLRLGVIKLPSFYARVGPSGGESTTRDVKVLLAYLKQQNVEGVILDLRSNGGGSLEEAVTMTGLFTGGGPVVQVRDSLGKVRVLSAPATGPDYSGPVAVLTSRFSASASEIVSAALKDYGRAVLVGEKSTYGKGTVQTVVDLDQYMPPALRQYKAGGLRLTIQKFYRVYGGSTQNLGVPPDIVLPSLNDYLDLAESSLPNALPYDQLPPAVYDRSDSVTPLELAWLRAASADRVAASANFKFVRQDIELYLGRRKDKTVSLNYARRLAERKEDEERNIGRNKERAARGIPPLPVTGITLQDIEAGKPLVLNSTAAAEVAASSGTPPGASVAALAVSSSAVPSAATASSAAVSGVAVSSSTAAGGDYARAPPVGDFVLEEAARVLSDMIAPLPRRSKE